MGLSGVHLCDVRGPGKRADGQVRVWVPLQARLTDVRLDITFLRGGLCSNASSEAALICFPYCCHDNLRIFMKAAQGREPRKF